MNSKELNLIIAEGEGLTVEFKEKYTSKIDRDIASMANAKGGFILLGVNDAGKIIGEKLTNRLKAEILSLARNCEPQITISKISQVDKVVVIEISEGNEKPHRCSSGYFRRLDAVTQKMTHLEIRTMFRESADISFEGLPCKGFSFKDISFEKVKIFTKESEVSYKISKETIHPLLSSLGIYKDDKICNAGALMF